MSVGFPFNFRSSWQQEALNARPATIFVLFPDLKPPILNEMASSGNPYLGSKVSLISKSDIRYEGTLYAIDAKESTLALARGTIFT